MNWLKPSPNSLFALLLRSPWWISALIALLIMVSANAILDGSWAFVMSSPSLPFIILACIAFYQQFNKPSTAQIESLSQEVSQLQWAAFAQRLEAKWSALGYQVTQRAGAADFELERHGRRVLVCARRWKAASQGIETVQALIQELDRRQAGEAWIVSLGTLTDAAARKAAERGLTVIGPEQLTVLLRGR